MNLKRNVLLFGSEHRWSNRGNNLLAKLESGKPVFLSFPLTDQVFPGKDRLAATFRSEGSPKSGFSAYDSSGRPFRVTAMLRWGGWTGK